MKSDTLFLPHKIVRYDKTEYDINHITRRVVECMVQALGSLQTKRDSKENASCVFSGDVEILPLLTEPLVGDKAGRASPVLFFPSSYLQIVNKSTLLSTI